MKPHVLATFLPAAIVILLAGLGWWKLRSNQIATEALLEKVSQIPGEPKPTLTAIPTPSENTLAELQSEQVSLASLIEGRTAVLKKTSEEADEWQEKIPLGTDELTSSLGKISDMGREAGKAIMGLSKVLALVDQKDLEEGYTDDLREAQMKLFTWASYIGELETEPADIARFQAAALIAFFEMDEGSTGDMEAVIAAQFTKMGAAQLTIADRPDKAEEADYEEWKTGRATALGELMSELRPQFPERHPMQLRQAIPSIINLGIGMETLTSSSPDGGGSVNLVLPTWPVPPWLDDSE